MERQERLIQEQIFEITEGIQEVEDTAMNHSLTVSDEQFERWTAQLKAQLAELEG